MTHDFPTTLQEAVLYVADLDRCRALMREIRWPDGVLTNNCKIQQSQHNAALGN